MAKVFTAVDIGASSGRLITGTLEDGRMYIQEQHRFKNSMESVEGHFYWDIDFLFEEIINGLKKCSNKFKNVESVSIDTWGVDYVLLDEENKRVAPVYAYRDHRTDNTMDKVFDIIDSKTIYEKTGIQFMQINTLYQLYEHIKNSPDDVEKADCFLMIPDYLNFLLSGKKAVEFTNATTTQVFNVHQNNWDEEILKKIGIDNKIMPNIIEPGTILGDLKKDVQKETGLNVTKVIAPATHDTGSAVASVPADSSSFAYISSGTWSLMGIESKNPICTEEARKYNFTNEGGVFETYRVLKNIMGLWLIQEVKRLYEDKYSFAQLADMAERAEPFKCLINPNDSRFLNPANMIEEIKSFCKETGQYVPKDPAEVARCIFESLAFQYKDVLNQLRDIQEEPINKIHIIGGGGKNKLLNQLCANITKCQVLAGPFEATAIGNITMQMIALKEIDSLKTARNIIKNSFDIETYTPIENECVEENYDKFRRLQNV
ncbi:MAG: rhamnulokinase [Eubacteriales bacterium]